MTPVIFFAILGLEQKSLFLDGHYLNKLWIFFETDREVKKANGAPNRRRVCEKVARDHLRDRRVRQERGVEENTGAGLLEPEFAKGKQAVEYIRGGDEERNGAYGTPPTPEIESGGDQAQSKKDSHGADGFDSFSRSHCFKQERLEESV